MAAAPLEVLFPLLLTLYHVIERLLFVPEKMLEKNIGGQIVVKISGIMLIRLEVQLQSKLNSVT